MYTSLQIRELGVVLDAGVPVRAFAGTDDLFLSHGHADHASGLGPLLGRERCPPDLAERVVVFAPRSGRWFG